ncbi:hypothetical protein BU23DRAFT_645778 [Bimuria novae-zelandiae CBS 107.79]|uniref:Uncharacterized protein n=1 Tax=Bimuria novae-zelandiae CBS 107.79 TaxID=1447943 RepID=A0A6A5VF17_9PLEO|nr:hypothetical protein BU23DRAFT_645778 [Bimuria novae-zelandiae CBS 107.79]
MDGKDTQDLPVVYIHIYPLFYSIASVSPTLSVIRAFEVWTQIARKGNSKRMWHFEIIESAPRKFWGTLSLFLGVEGQVFVLQVVASTLLSLAIAYSLQNVVHQKVGGTFNIEWEWEKIKLSLYISWLACSITEMVDSMVHKSNESEVVGVWKTSAIATLLYGLPENMQSAIVENKNKRSGLDFYRVRQAGSSTIEKLQVTVNEVKVSWTPKEGWRFSGDGSPPAAQNPEVPFNMRIKRRDHSDHTHIAEDDGTSVSSSDKSSVFSAALSSLSSTAANVSVANGYEILLAALEGNEKLDSLDSLYFRAIEDLAIGPEKLQHLLKRVIEQFAVHLKGEASDQLEHLGAQLLAQKATLLSKTVVNSKGLKLGARKPGRFEFQCLTVDREEQDSGAEIRKPNIHKLMTSILKILLCFAGLSPTAWISRAAVESWLYATEVEMCILQKPARQSTLPQHSVNAATTVSRQAEQTPRLLHLIMRIHSSNLGKMLQQNCIDTINTDRKLFLFLRQLYSKSRGSFRRFLSLRAVKGIHFTKLNLFAGGSVEARHHAKCCQDLCTCIPDHSLVEPSDKAEYRCNPAGPLRSGPPILPDILGHFFSSPGCILYHDTSILNRLPKRICGELQGSVGEAAEGWSLYFEEGWNSDGITTLVFVIFLVGSLLFGVL